MSKFKVGQVWKRRDGSTVMIASIISAPEFPIIDRMGYSYALTGKYLWDGPDHNFDLIELVQDVGAEPPKPEAPANVSNSGVAHAFPCACGPDDMSYEGMTLRDYFAAKAMQADITGNISSDMRMHAIADRAYALADVMLEARKKS